jgi:hypothetical protein
MIGTVGGTGALRSETSEEGGAGVDAYLLDRSWNAHARDVQRVPSVAAFVEMVLKVCR